MSAYRRTTYFYVYFLMPSMAILIYGFLSLSLVWICRRESQTKPKISEETQNRCVWVNGPRPNVFSMEKHECLNRYRRLCCHHQSGGDVDGERAACTGASMRKHSTTRTTESAAWQSMEHCVSLLLRASHLRSLCNVHDAGLSCVRDRKLLQQHHHHLKSVRSAPCSSRRCKQ